LPMHVVEMLSNSCENFTILIAIVEAAQLSKGKNGQSATDRHTHLCQIVY